MINCPNNENPKYLTPQVRNISKKIMCCPKKSPKTRPPGKGRGLGRG